MTVTDVLCRLMNWKAKQALMIPGLKIGFDPRSLLYARFML